MIVQLEQQQQQQQSILKLKQELMPPPLPAPQTQINGFPTPISMKEKKFEEQSQGNVMLGHFWFETPTTTGTRIPPAAQSKSQLWSLNDHQNQLLEYDASSTINPDLEKQRCQRYGYDYDPHRTKTPSHLLWGLPGG